MSRGAHVPGSVVAWMILFPQYDLVAGGQRNAAVDQIVCLAGVPDEHNLVRRNAQLAAYLLARVFQDDREFGALPGRNVAILIARQRRYPSRYRPRRRPQLGRVHRDVTGPER